MIDYDYNNYTPEPRKPVTPNGNADETIDWLEAHCDFRPMGAEW